MIGSAGGGILLLQHKAAEAELRALFQYLPRYAVFPVRFGIEFERDRLDLVLGEVARHLLERLLLLVQSDIEHLHLAFK